MSAVPRLIRWLDEPDGIDLAELGGKGANLARFSQAGFPVPPGFCVAARAYRDFVAAGGLQERIGLRLAELPDLAAVEVAAAEIQAAIERHPIPPAVAEAIGQAYSRLDGGAARVAVRSSATAEDLPEASFAGQQETFLNVRGYEALLHHVRRCWASLWTARAIAYRREHGVADHGLALAVVVQAMVEAEVAGVMFTANPINGRRDEVVINASYGLGEAVVSGLVTPDTFVVRPRQGLIRERTIGHKSVEILYSPIGLVEEHAVGEERAGAASLTDAQVLDLAALGLGVAAHAGRPQDCEWALRDGRAFLLQARPITTLGEPPAYDPRDHWTRAMFVEILPDAPSPAFCSVLVPILGHMLAFTFRSLGQQPPADIPAVAVFCHQPYLNLRYIRAALAGLPDEARERLTERIANPFTAHDQSGADRSLAELRLGWHVLRVVRRLPRALPKIVERYYSRLRPYEALDLARQSDAELCDAVDAIVTEIVPPLIDWDYLLIAALGLVGRLMDRTVDRSGVPSPEAVRGQLHSGMTGNLTMHTNKALWQLARAARSEPAVARAILDGPDEGLLGRLSGLPGGVAFRRALDQFLWTYGHREIRMDIVYPTWGEDPTPVLRFLRAYLAADGAPDPVEQERLLAEQRRRAAAEVESALAGTARGRLIDRRLFRWSLEHTRALAADRDTMHFHWTYAFPILRRLLEELGRRWVAQGLLDRVEDIYCLAIDELPAVVAEPRPLQAEVARSRRAWERDRARTWPHEIRQAEEIYPDDVAVAEPIDGALRGIPGSPGRASGAVRIIRGPEDFGLLRQGEILVAPLTNPTWTPLFAIAGGLVIESGGILSHGAIVAREYGIPAVMGVAGASRTLSTGQQVTVDGTGGLVGIDR
jgi:pyruvate,water dikinase